MLSLHFTSSNACKRAHSSSPASPRRLRPHSRSRRRPSPPTPRPHLDSTARSPGRTLTPPLGSVTCLPRFRPSTSPRLKPIETPNPDPLGPSPSSSSISIIPQFKVAAPHKREKPHPKNRGKKHSSLSLAAQKFPLHYHSKPRLPGAAAGPLPPSPPLVVCCSASGSANLRLPGAAPRRGRSSPPRPLVVCCPASASASAAALLSRWQWSGDPHGRWLVGFVSIFVGK